MEESLENWISQLEMDEDDFLDESHLNYLEYEQEFLTEILQQPDFSPESGEIATPYHPCSATQNNAASAAVDGGATSPTDSSVSFDETSFDDGHGTTTATTTATTTTTTTTLPKSNSYILSFDKSSVEPVIQEPCSKHGPTLKRTRGNDGLEVPRGHQATKKFRTKDHRMAERQRRKELTGKIIALSATIPGLTKVSSTTT